MIELIHKLNVVVNALKDFSAGYGSNTVKDGKMIIEYKDKRYAVKIQEIENPDDNIFKDIERLKYII